MKKYRLPWLSYADFKASRIEPKYFGTTCFVQDCTEPARFEGGDERFHCGMCEFHARIREQYDAYIAYRESPAGRYGLEGRDD